jgi:hypothetical protein
MQFAFSELHRFRHFATAVSVETWRVDHVLSRDDRATERAAITAR